MKLSRYNFSFNEDNGTILYNIATDGILQLNTQVAELVSKYSADIDSLQDIHPELYTALKKYGFIVDNNIDEIRSLTDNWNEQLTDKKKFRFTVNPTLNCNLCCWYCYENHNGHKVMSNDTLERTKKCLQNTIKDNNLKSFCLDFFGGEPLLQFDCIVYPLIVEAYNMCHKYKKKFHLSFTTNGTLLTANKIEKIASLLNTSDDNCKTIPSFQITLDGNEEFHNKVRKSLSGEGSYQTIMSNIRIALNYGYDVFVRFNTTNENIDSYLDVIDDFADIPKEQAAHLQFDLQKVWQDNASQLTREKLAKLSEELTAEGYHVAVQSVCNRIFCYADNDNSIVVNYDGNVYKCTAREFNPELAEGHIDSDGNIIYNSRHTRRKSLRFGNKVCRQCKIYPICHGGCTQDKIESDGQELCIRHYSEEKREEIVKERLRYLISNRKK